MKFSFVRCIGAACVISSLVACEKESSQAGDSSASATRAVATDTAHAASASSSGSSSVPPVIDSIGAQGEDLYDAIAAANWTKANALADKLANDLRNVPGISRDAAADLPDYVDSATASIAGKQMHAGLLAANEITRIAAEMTKAFVTATPVEVQLLDYDGRAIEIWSAVKDTVHLRKAASDAATAWTAIKASVIAKKGAAVAAKMDGIISKLTAAKTAAEFRASANALLDAVDELEKVFRS